jgi:UDP-N-acetylglucosamine diphosphorylase/glucosamine-1-phosphate N-acetyltransferase
MKLIIYEDKPERFYPLVSLQPQFYLRIGMKTIAEHIAQFCNTVKISYIGRDIFHFKRIASRQPVVYLSSRFLPSKTVVLPKKDMKFVAGNDVIGFIKYEPPFPQNSTEIASALRRIRMKRKLPGLVLQHVWDLIKYHEQLLPLHMSHRAAHRVRAKISINGDRRKVHVARDAHIHDHVFIDTSDGPVYIDSKATILPFSSIVGPSFIGAGSIIDRAKVVKSSIGPVCRVGGEVEACVFQGHVNKHHEGFIGHSFVGEWVNLGALTTNSDLKNNYGQVRVFDGKRKRNSGMTKLGCFIGDHTKLGIGTLIPTGALIGSFVNFFGGGMMPQYVPDFTWLTVDKQESYKLSKALATARLVMKRRGKRMTKQYEKLIRKCYTWRSSLSQ